MPDSDEPRAIHAFASGLIDYAGLFPPAKLDMPAAVKNYADYLRSPDAWMLGRFIVPVSRLAEFEKAAAGLLPTGADDEPWPISALIDGELEPQLDAVWNFSSAHAKPAAGLAVIDAVEIKLPSLEAGPPAIDAALDLMPEPIFPFFEIPVGQGDVRGCIAALSGSDAAAKIRTGGVTPGAFPSPGDVAEFLLACHAADVPFKATAGLHHAVRAEYNLTYEPGCPRSIMHGFVNLFLAAAFARTARAPLEGLVSVLQESDPRAFSFADDHASWRDKRLEALQLAQARESFALSFGSCSFTEPSEELRNLGWLAR